MKSKGTSCPSCWSCTATSTRSWLEEALTPEDLAGYPGRSGYHIVVAEEEGELVSTCTLLIVPNLTHLAALRSD